jgi:hypothetical protein
LPADAPSARRKVADLRAAIERCLADEPSARHHSATDVRAAIDTVQADTGEVSRSAWQFMLSRKRVVGGIDAVMAEGERRIRRERRTG